MIGRERIPLNYPRQSYIDRNTYFDVARPFKSAAWERKKAARTGKTKTTKQILQAERDRGARHILEDGTQGEMLGCELGPSDAPES
jgi:hypothetical protein